MTSGPGWVTPDELADVSDIPVLTIRYHLRKGNIPGARRAGRAWLIPADEADRWARSYELYGTLRKQREGRPAPPG